MPGYSPPTGNNVEIQFAAAYTPPAGDSLSIQFADEGATSQTIYPSGWDAFAAGIWAFGVSGRQFIEPTGFDVAEMGGVGRLYLRWTISHDFTEAYTPPVGSGVSHAFGYGLVLFPSGIDTAEFGTASLQTTPSIGPAGIDALEFGTAYVYKQQFVTTAGIDVVGFGTTAIENQHRYFDFTGFDTAQYGTAVLTRTNFSQTITPTGADYARLGAQAVTKSLEIGLASYGLDAAAVGAAEVSFYERAVTPLGVDAAEFGTTEVSNFYRYLTPTGLDALEVGVPAVRLNAPYPFGFDAAKIGTHVVANFRQFAEPNGLDTVAFGDTTISNYTRYITPTGFSTAALGTVSISNFIRYITPTGIAPPDLSAGNWVSFYIRYLTPTGWDAARVWWDYSGVDPTGRAPGVYNETGHIVATGFDAAGVGAPQLLGAPAVRGAGEWTQRASFGSYPGIVDAGGIDAAEFGTAAVHA